MTNEEIIERYEYWCENRQFLIDTTAPQMQWDMQQAEDSVNELLEDIETAIDEGDFEKAEELLIIIDGDNEDGDEEPEED